MVVTGLVMDSSPASHMIPERIVRDMAALSRPDPARMRARLTAIAAEALRWLHVTFHQSVAVRVEDRGAPDVLVSGSQIQQVLVNLLTNAAKAAPAGKSTDVIVSGIGLRAVLHDATDGRRPGSLTVESVPGKGSTFRMEIPGAPAGV